MRYLRTKKILNLTLAVFLNLTFAGCVTPTTLSVSSADSSTSTEPPITYSRFFEAKSSLINDSIQINAVAKIHWKKPQIESLDPNIKYVLVDIKVHLNNTTEQQRDFRIYSMSLESSKGKEYIILEPRLFTLIPLSVERIEKHGYVMVNSDTHIVLNMQYQNDGKLLNKKIILQRVTSQELNNRKDLPSIF